MSLNTPRIVWILAGALFVLVSIWIHYQVKVAMPALGRAEAAQLGEIEVGSDPPDFTAVDLQGREFALSGFRDRKIVVIDFWATWCAPCLMAMPELQELATEFGGRGVELMAVNLGEDPERVRRFVGREEYTFRVVADPDQGIGTRFGVDALPALVVVGVDGRVACIQVGYHPDKMAELRNLLERLTEELPAAGSGSEASEGV